MSLVHIHLMTNHVPVIGIIIGLTLLIVGLTWKSPDLKRFTLYYFVALGVVSLLVFFTGEPAERAVENVAGISESLIERHEDASVFGMAAVGMLALLSLIGLLFKSGQLLTRRWYTASLLILSLFTTAAMGWIANLGGKIRHTEIGQPQAANQIGEDD